MRRGPIRTAIPVVRQAFEIIDGIGLPLSKIPVNTSRDNLARWRRGVSSPEMQTFTEVMANLGYDLVLVPRPGTRTLRAPQPAAGTSRRVGTGGGAAAPAGG